MTLVAMSWDFLTDQNCSRQRPSGESPCTAQRTFCLIPHGPSQDPYASTIPSPIQQFSALFYFFYFSFPQLLIIIERNSPPPLPPTHFLAFKKIFRCSTLDLMSTVIIFILLNTLFYFYFIIFSLNCNEIIPH